MGACLYSLLEKNAKTSSESIEEAVKRLEQIVPVGYFSTPDEFAQSILFLASEEAGYINGTSIPLDGGSSKSVY